MARHAFQRLGTLLVVVVGTEAPTDEEWQQYLDACVALDRELGGLSRVSALIFSDGGSPTRLQLVGLDKVLRQRTGVSAVVCDSLRFRAVMSLFGLINPALRVFPSRDWKLAATFARIDESRHAEVLQVAADLGRQIGEVKVLHAIEP
jgi:hypothetical protein